MEAARKRRLRMNPLVFLVLVLLRGLSILPRLVAREIIVRSAPSEQRAKLRKLSFWARDDWWRRFASTKSLGPRPELGKALNAGRAAGVSEWRILLLQGGADPDRRVESSAYARTFPGPSRPITS